MQPRFTDKPQRHGMTGTRIYNIYRGMKLRCYDKNDYHYKWYGAKGVKMCHEWATNFKSFYDWSMEHGYKDDLSIDRIDVNGDYCPENCRWITHKEQCNNRHNSRYIEINGVIKTLAQWLEFYSDRNLATAVVQRRLKKGIKGEALFEPVKTHHTRKRIIQLTLDGKIIRIFESGRQITKELGFCANPIYSVCHGKKFCHTAYGYKWKYED